MTEVIASPDLRYKTTRRKDGKVYVIKIRLNDECKNGHQDFSITGDIYEAGKPMTDGNCLSSGAIGDEIAEQFPDLKIFNDLHLCDYDGVPMHAVANGWYHLHHDLGRTKIDDPNHAKEYCEYYRITPEQFKALSQCNNQNQFAWALERLGIPAQWKAQAQEAIAKLEELTGQKFLNNSQRSQLIMPTEEAKKEEEHRQATGYYTPEAVEARRKQARQDKLDKLNDERRKKIDEINREYDAIEWLTKRDISTENFIYYNHSDEACFGWREPMEPSAARKLSERLHREGFATRFTLKFKTTGPMYDNNK